MLAKVETEIDLRHHVLVTEPGAEFRAERHLKAQGFEPWVPSETVTAYRTVRNYMGTTRRPHQVTRPIFRGYIMLPLNQAWSFGPFYGIPGLRATPFLIICGKPAVVPEREIARLQEAEQKLKGAPIEGLPYQVGDQVRILQGAFTGFAAEIAKLDDASRIELLMDLLGARTKIHLAAHQFEPHD
jgi:transcription antitermination factor NusG